MELHWLIKQASSERGDAGLTFLLSLLNIPPCHDAKAALGPTGWRLLSFSNQGCSASDVVLLLCLCCWPKWTLRSDVLVAVMYCLEWFTVLGVGLCMPELNACLPNRINTRHVSCMLTDIKQILYHRPNVIFGKWGNAKLTSGGSRFTADDLYWEAKMEKKAREPGVLLVHLQLFRLWCSGESE